MARDVAPYVVSPPLAVRRLDRYDGHPGTDHSRSQRTERTEWAQVEVDTLSGRMMPPTVPKGCKRSRYAGVQASKTCAKVKHMRQDAWAQVEGVVKGAVQRMARLTSPQRDEQRTGREPLICPHGRGARGWWRIWHPTYGGIDDEVQVIQRGP